MAPFLLAFILLAEIMGFLALLVYLKRHFEKKYFTPAAKRELNNFITAFNRQAESSLLLLDSRIKHARALRHSLEQYKNSLPLPNIPSTPSVVKQAPAGEKPAQAQLPSTAPLAPAPSVKLPSTAPLAPAPSVKLPSTAPLAPAPSVKLPSPPPLVPAPSVKLPSTAPLVPAPSIKKSTPPHRNPTAPTNELGAQILMLAQDDNSLENIARNLALPLNEVRLRLSMHKQQLSKQQARLKKRLTT